jgi:hypothetical protein
MPIAYVEHQIPGRLRLRIPERRGDVTFFQRVVGALSKVPDVTELDGSPLTGSVRIRYSGTAEAIAAAAAKEGLFEICKRDGEAQPKKPPKEPASPGAPHGDAGMLDSIATGLSGLALFQVTQGQVTGTAPPRISGTPTGRSASWAATRLRRGLCFWDSISCCKDNGLARHPRFFSMCWRSASSPCSIGPQVQ